jgi:hypothetical protein
MCDGGQRHRGKQNREAAGRIQPIKGEDAMRAKTLLAGGAMFLSMVVLGNARSWDVSFDSASKAGAVTLPAGNYKVKVKDNQATFMAESGKTYNVPVKVEQAGRKYEQTAVEMRADSGNQVIEAIQLGGTVDKLDFGTE